MRLKIILFTASAVVFLGIGVTRADDMSDLKEQVKALQDTINVQQKTIETLNAKIQSIEMKQEVQSKEIQKVPELSQKVSELKEKSADKGLLEGVTVGGHLKMFVFDRTDGSRNGVNQHNNLSAGVNHFYLYITKDLTDWLKVDVQPDFSVNASATPIVGSDISRARTADTSVDLHQAFLTAQLPKQAELKVGIFQGMFSEEYAKETWWHELQFQNVGLANLQEFEDQGIELYKNFDFAKWSLPVYVSLLGGNRVSSDSYSTTDPVSNTFVDNNDNKTVLFHIAPELFQTKLRLLGSFAYGRWDDKGQYDMYHYLAGFDWKYQKFNLTGEYIYRLFKNLITIDPVRANGAQAGYWLKAMYTFNPKWRALVKYSHADLFKTGISADMLSDKYDTTTLAVDYSLMPSSTVIAQYSFIAGSRSDGSDKLRANRFTLGWRTTF